MLPKEEEMHMKCLHHHNVEEIAKKFPFTSCSGCEYRKTTEDDDCITYCELVSRFS